MVQLAQLRRELECVMAVVMVAIGVGAIATLDTQVHKVLQLVVRSFPVGSLTEPLSGEYCEWHDLCANRRD